MELWNEHLVNENLPTEIKSKIIGCQNQMGKFDLFFKVSPWALFVFSYGQSFEIIVE